MKHARFVNLAMVVALAFATGCGSDKTTQAPIPSDDAPPLPPTGLSASFNASGLAEVTWTPNSEADLAGYRVYLYSPSPSRPSAYELQNTEALLTANTVELVVPIGGEIWVSVSAVDLGDNESSNSPPLQVRWQQPADNGDDGGGKPTLEGEQQPDGTRHGGTSTPNEPDSPPDGGGSGDEGTTPGDDPNQH